MDNNFFFDRAEIKYENRMPPEDIELGQCYVCGWPVREDSKFEYIHGDLKHTDCKEEKL